MGEETKKSVLIDLNEFKLHLRLPPKLELTLHFDSPSRKFYLSVIALVVHEMERRGQITSVCLREHLDVLALLNDTIGASAGSSAPEHLLPRIYRKWKDSLPDLAGAPLFRVLGKKKRYGDLKDRIYEFSEDEKDSWANLFEYRGSHESVRLRFSVDRLGASPEDVALVYGGDPERPNGEAWESFLADLAERRLLPAEPAPGGSDAVGPGSSRSLRGSWAAKMRRSWRSPLVYVLVGFAVAAVATAVWRSQPSGRQFESASIAQMALPLPERPSIVVLPFRNLTEDSRGDLLGYGIAEGIIAGLCKIPHIFVIDRNSTFTYKGSNPKYREVSERLGVRYVLEGSVGVVGDRIRITYSLADAIKGEKLFADSCDRSLGDVFSIQDEIAIKILTSLQVQLVPGEKDRLPGRYTNDLRAYLKVLEGVGYMDEFKMDAGLKCFEAARTLDPQFAEAYAREAWASIRISLFGPKTTRLPSILRAMEAAKKCSELDDDLALCHMAMSLVHLAANLDYFNAIAEARRAVERWPNSAEAATFLAMSLQFAGRYEEALVEIKRALRLDPVRPVFALGLLCTNHFNSGRIDDAIATCEKVLDLSSLYFPAHIMLALSYSERGFMGKAGSSLTNVYRLCPEFDPDEYRFLFSFRKRANMVERLNSLMDEVER